MALLTSVEKSKTNPALYLCVTFEVRDKAGRLLAKENTRASDASAWNLSWDSIDRIKLESSDIGTYFWDRQADGTWKRNPPLDQNPK